MTVQARLVVAGMSAVEAQADVGTVANNLTATGSSQATAVTLGADFNRFTTVAASTGCIIPPLNPGDTIQVFNAGANALSLYPPSGGIINALSANAAYSIATATPFCQVSCITPTQYHCMQSA